MKHSRAWRVFTLLWLSFPACGGGGGGGGGGGAGHDGGVSTGGAGGGAGGATGNTAACGADVTDLDPTYTQLAPSNPIFGIDPLRDFSVGSNGVIVVDPMASPVGSGLNQRGAIVRFPFGGEPAQVLYSPTDETHFVGPTLAISGAAILFLEGTRGAGLDLRKLAADGTAVIVATALSTGTFFYGYDTTNAYLVAPGNNSNYTLIRINIADGTTTIIADQHSSLFSSAQIANGLSWFAVDQGNGPFWKTPNTSAGSSEQMQVTTKTCFGGIRVLANGFVCGAAANLDQYDATFANLHTLYTAPGAGVTLPRATTPSAVVFHELRGDGKMSTLRTVPLAGGSSTVLACVELLGGVGIQATSVYWLQTDGNHAKIRRAALP